MADIYRARALPWPTTLSADIIALTTSTSKTCTSRTGMVMWQLACVRVAQADRGAGSSETVRPARPGRQEEAARSRGAERVSRKRASLSPTAKNRRPALPMCKAIRGDELSGVSKPRCVKTN